MMRLIGVSLLAGIATVPLVLLANGNYYILLLGCTVILAGMAALDADRFLDSRQRSRKLR